MNVQRGWIMGVTWCTGDGSLQDRASTPHFYFTISKNKNFKPSPGDLNHVPKISNFPTPRDFGLIVLLTVPWTCHMIQTQDFPLKKKTWAKANTWLKREQATLKALQFKVSFKKKYNFLLAVNITKIAHTTNNHQLIRVCKGGQL